MLYLDHVLAIGLINSEISHITNDNHGVVLPNQNRIVSQNVKIIYVRTIYRFSQIISKHFDRLLQIHYFSKDGNYLRRLFLIYTITIKFTKRTNSGYPKQRYLAEIA